MEVSMTQEQMLSVAYVVGGAIVVAVAITMSRYALRSLSEVTKGWLLVPFGIVNCVLDTEPRMMAGNPETVAMFELRLARYDAMRKVNIIVPWQLASMLTCLGIPVFMSGVHIIQKEEERKCLFGK